MEERLTQLINILSKKFSTVIISTSEKSEWRYSFLVPLKLDERFEYEIGLISVTRISHSSLLKKLIKENPVFPIPTIRTFLPLNLSISILITSF